MPPAVTEKYSVTTAGITVICKVLRRQNPVRLLGYDRGYCVFAEKGGGGKGKQYDLRTLAATRVPKILCTLA